MDVRFIAGIKGAVLATALMAAHSVFAVTIYDFENESGQVTRIGDMTVSAIGGINEAWVYDTGAAGNDPDLTAPFGGAGGVGSISPGKVLIVQENNSGGPDDTGAGGTLTLKFDNAITLLSMDVFDMKSGSNIQLFADGKREDPFLVVPLLDRDTNNNVSNNQYEQVIFGGGGQGISGVTSLNVVMTASGAIDNVAVVPIPAAAWLFGSALLGMATISRRRTESV